MHFFFSFGLFLRNYNRNAFSFRFPFVLLFVLQSLFVLQTAAIVLAPANRNAFQTSAYVEEPLLAALCQSPCTNWLLNSALNFHESLSFDMLKFCDLWKSRHLQVLHGHSLNQLCVGKSTFRLCPETNMQTKHVASSAFKID